MLKKFLLRYIVPSNKYVLIKRNININEKIKKDLIKFNLKNELIYSNIYYFKTKDSLYIYNTDYNKRFFIPEGLILFYGIEEKDGIFLIKNKNYYNVIIKSDNRLIDEFILEKLDDEEKKFLEYEYSLPINEKNYNLILENGFKKFDYTILINLWDLSFDYKNLKNNILDMGLPFFIAVLLSFVLVFSLNLYLENKIQEKSETLNQVRLKNAVIAKKIKEIDYLNKEWITIKNFVKQKNVTYFLNKLAFYVKDKGRISYFRSDGGNVLFTIDAKDITPIITAFSKDKDFEKINLISNININKTIKRFRFEGSFNGIK
jgi:hypothetical protein